MSPQCLSTGTAVPETCWSHCVIHNGLQKSDSFRHDELGGDHMRQTEAEINAEIELRNDGAGEQGRSQGL